MGHRHRYQLGEPGHDLDRFQGCVRTIPERKAERERERAEEIGSMGGRSDERRSRAETDGDESERRERRFRSVRWLGEKRQDDGRARIVPPPTTDDSSRERSRVDRRLFSCSSRVFLSSCRSRSSFITRPIICPCSTPHSITSSSPQIFSRRPLPSHERKKWRNL